MSLKKNSRESQRYEICRAIRSIIKISAKENSHHVWLLSFKSGAVEKKDACEKDAGGID